MLVTENRRIIEGTVNVNVGDTNPVKIFIGALVIALLTYWFFTGVLTGLVSSSYCSFQEDCCASEICEGGMESATYFIFQLISGACWLVGSAITFIWSGLLWVVGDILQGVRKFNAVREQKQMVVDQVTQQVTQEALAVDDVAPSDPFAYLNARINKRVDAAKLKPVLEDILSRLDIIEEQAEIIKPEPIVPPTVESLSEQLKAMQAMLQEQAAPKKTTAKKAPAKKDTTSA